MKTKMMILMLLMIVQIMGCYTLGKRLPLWDVRRTVNPPRESIPERVDDLELRVYTDIWTQC